MSADEVAVILTWFCGVCVRVTNFYDETTRPGKMQFVLKDTLRHADKNLFMVSWSIIVLQSSSKKGTPLFGENILTLFQFFSMIIEGICLIVCIYTVAE